jgi:hypothetical protein
MISFIFLMALGVNATGPLRVEPGALVTSGVVAMLVSLDGIKLYQPREKEAPRFFCREGAQQRRRLLLDVAARQFVAISPEGLQKSFACVNVDSIIRE